MPWGFDPTTIRAPTTCVYGEADGLVLPAHGQWWSDRISQSELLRIPGAGHLVIREAWRLVTAAATSIRSGAAA